MCKFDQLYDAALTYAQLIVQDGGLGRSVYDGEWYSGLFHGTGIFTCPDGRMYEGEV
jgi:hypothetical protein